MPSMRMFLLRRNHHRRCCCIDDDPDDAGSVLPPKKTTLLTMRSRSETTTSIARRVIYSLYSITFVVRTQRVTKIVQSKKVDIAFHTFDNPRLQFRFAEALDEADEKCYVNYDESATDKIEVLSLLLHTHTTTLLLLFSLDTVGGGRRHHFPHSFGQILRPKRKLRHVHFLYPSWVSHRFPKLIRLQKFQKV